MKSKFGFTLIELLVVIGILAILLSIVLIAINPFRQFSQANDLAIRAAVFDMNKAAGVYFASEKVYPWEKNELCKAEVEAGGQFSNMAECIKEMTGFDENELSKNEKDKLSKIEVNKCKDQAVMCYLPSTKEVIEDAIYDKWGVVKPGCPDAKDLTECYWCKKVKQDDMCGGPPLTPTPTPSITPEPIACTRADVSGYTINDTKLFRTYGVFLFDHPGFPVDNGGSWPIQFSLNPDFNGTYGTDYVNNIAYGSDIADRYYPNTNSWTIYKIVSGNKYAAFYSIASHPIYLNNCGKTVYWRATARRYDENNNYLYTEYGPSNISKIDCDTKVGVLATNSWYTVYDYITHSQKEYKEEWDMDCSGYIDWTDYWMAALSTNDRAGGWQPPE